ncbi:MAG: hypothetical protein ABI670_13220 [Chloroflexota bacterium]
MLRFDGLYQAPADLSKAEPVDYFDYLRFYEDGWVIDCTSSGTPEQVIAWFYRDNPEQPAQLTGRYIIDGDMISFSPEYRYDDEGEEVVMLIEYDGVIKDGGSILDLQVSSRMTGHKSVKVFRFVRVIAQVG